MDDMPPRRRRIHAREVRLRVGMQQVAAAASVLNGSGGSHTGIHWLNSTQQEVPKNDYLSATCSE